jgi:predicted SAM-dependent methyltransferase
LPGWTNVDFYFPADVSLDLRYGLPIPDDSVQFIYSEHLVEHFSLNDSLRLFSECRRVLAADGVMRVATPDLTEIVRDYRMDWRKQDWVNWDEYQWIDSGACAVNTAVREWGHLYLWDFEEMDTRLRSLGFQDVLRCDLGESDNAELRGLETRADSLLVVEARLGTEPT